MVENPSRRGELATYTFANQLLEVCRRLNSLFYTHQVLKLKLFFSSVLSHVQAMWRLLAVRGYLPSTQYGDVLAFMAAMGGICYFYNHDPDHLVSSTEETLYLYRRTDDWGFFCCVSFLFRETFVRSFSSFSVTKVTAKAATAARNQRRSRRMTTSKATAPQTAIMLTLTVPQLQTPSPILTALHLWFLPRMVLLHSRVPTVLSRQDFASAKT